MSRSRIFYHPVLSNKRSRWIFLIFLTLSMVVGAWVWWEFERCVGMTGLSLKLGPPSENAVLNLFLSPFFRFAVIFGGAVLAGGLTAQHIIGPIKRIELWLLDREAGHKVQPLRVRKGDKFTELARLVNEQFGSESQF